MQNAFFHTPYNVGIGGEAPPFSYKEYRKTKRWGRNRPKSHPNAESSTGIV